MEQDILKRISELGVLKQGHFLLTSGRHSDRFLLSSQLTVYPQETAWILGLLAQQVQQAQWQPSVVIGPAMGGVILAYELAKALGCRAMYAEKEGEGMALKRGFTLTAADKVLVVEDTISTGGSVQKVVDIVAQSPAELVGVAVLFDRTKGQVTFAGKPPLALLQLEMVSWLPEDCPLCRQGVPVVAPKS